MVAEVNEILEPMVVNASWDMGLLFNATMYFRKGTVRVPADAYNTLVWIVLAPKNGIWDLIFAIPRFGTFSTGTTTSWASPDSS